MNKKSILYLLTAILLLSSCTQGVPKEEQTKEEIKVEVETDEEEEEEKKNLSEEEKLFQEYLTL